MIKEILDAPSYTPLWYVQPNVFSIKFGMVAKRSSVVCQVSLKTPVEEQYYLDREEVEIFLTREEAVTRFIKVTQDVYYTCQLQTAVDIARENGIDLSAVLPSIEKRLAKTERKYIADQIHKLETELAELKAKLLKQKGD